MVHYQILEVENIVSYLTNIDIEKGMQGQLDDSDIIAIISRIIEPTPEEINRKTR